jgi:hypothetical protein
MVFFISFIFADNTHETHKSRRQKMYDVPVLGNTIEGSALFEVPKLWKFIDANVSESCQNIDTGESTTESNPLQSDIL